MSECGYSFTSRTFANVPMEHQTTHLQNGDIEAGQGILVRKVPFLLPRSDLPLFKDILDMLSTEIAANLRHRESGQ